MGKVGNYIEISMDNFDQMNAILTRLYTVPLPELFKLMHPHGGARES
jgi:hypothetical protein